MKENIQQPSNLEMQVLSVLWDNGPSTARQVLEAMPDGKKRAYTTVLSVLQMLEKKTLVTHDAQGNAHVYKPCVSKRKVLRPYLRDMVRNVFGGSPSEAMQFLLQETTVSDDEYNEIRKTVDEFNQQSGKKPK